MPRGGFGQRLGIAGRFDRRLGGEDLTEALGGAGRLGELAIDLGELAEGACGKDGVENELRQAPAGHLARQHVLRSVPEHAHHARRDQEDAGTRKEGPHGGREPCRIEGLLGGGGEAGGREALHAEGLHGPHRADGLRRIGRGIGKPVLRRPRAPPHGPSREHQGQDDDGYREQHQGGELRARDDHEHGRAQEEEEVAQGDRDADPESRLDLGRVRGEPRHDLTAPGLVEEGRIEGGQVPEDGGAQIGHHPLAEGNDKVIAQRARQGEHAHHDDQEDEIGIDVGPALLGKAEIDHAAYGDGHDQRGRGGQGQGHQRRRDPALVGEAKGNERLQGAQRSLGAGLPFGEIGHDTLRFREISLRQGLAPLPRLVSRS